MRYLIFPDIWEAGAGSEPMRGPIDASDARSAYHLAVARGLYPAGVTFGLRVIACEEDGTGNARARLWSPALEHRALLHSQG